MTGKPAGQTRALLDADDPLPPIDDRRTNDLPDVEHVYRIQRPRLLRFLINRTSVDAADDILQDSFVQALSLASAAPIRRLDSYLFRVARTVTADHARAARQRSSAEHVPLDDVERATHGQVPSADQIAALEARDMLNRLEAVMQRMKPRTREIFLAHRVDGYTYAEIAARTGLSVKGVEKHMSRAIAIVDRGLRYR